jgi:hypothetical protein
MNRETFLKIHCETASIGQLYDFLMPSTTTVKKAASVVRNPTTRNVKWSPGNNYVLIKSGNPVAVEEDISAKTDVSYLYIFKNIDSGVERNPSVPMYEATFYCADGAYYVRAQKCHLKRIYTKCGHIDLRKAWCVDESTGLPYWVDRYAFSRTKIKSS